MSNSFKTKQQLFLYRLSPCDNKGEGAIAFLGERSIIKSSIKGARANLFISCSISIVKSSKKKVRGGSCFLVALD
jgi:hypothetical protein